MNSSHRWFKSKFTALPSFHKRRKKNPKPCNKINDHLCLHFCWCISASKIIFTYSEVGDTLFICYQLRTACRAVRFCAVLHSSLWNAPCMQPFHGVTPATAAEDGLMSRARETQVRCVTSTMRRPTCDSELGCARSTGQREKAAAPALSAQTIRAPLKQSCVPKASNYPHNSSCSTIS